MLEKLEVRINGGVVSKSEIESWELRRARSVLGSLCRVLKVPHPNSAPNADLAQVRRALVGVKQSVSRDAMRNALRRRTSISAFMTRLMLRVAGSRRKACVVEVMVRGSTAALVSRTIDALMNGDSAESRATNLLACPDHYLLEPCGDILEVIETTGGSPLPAQFFMRFDDESGLTTPRDAAFSHQSAGTARLQDGTVIGGVRHQFRDDGKDAFVRLLVEFPAGTPKRMISEHQMHLACEFSHWLSHVPLTAGAP